MTETFNYNSILTEHGIGVLQKVRQFENISKIKGRYQSHLRFYLQCKHKQLTPKGIKVKSQMHGPEARKIIEKAEKALINIRIGEVIRKNKTLEKKIQDVAENLRSILPNNTHSKIVEINENRKKREFEKSREKQKKKYFLLRDGNLNAYKNTVVQQENRTSFREDERSSQLELVNNIENSQQGGNEVTEITDGERETKTEGEEAVEESREETAEDSKENEERTEDEAREAADEAEIIAEIVVEIYDNYAFRNLCIA